MRTGTRLGLYGSALVVAFGAAFGAAGAVVPDSAVESWTQQSRTNEHGTGDAPMDTHGEDQQDAGGMTGYDHPADGGAPPEGIEAAENPAYPLGTTVRLTADHMPGMNGAEATISGAFTTTAYSVSFTPTTGGEPVTDHKWVVHEELESPGQPPLPDGTEVVLEAGHMAGMQGATATIDHSTQETVYMVDLATDDMTMTNHKWVLESEIQPAR
ncbi:hypothetical protein BH708_08185 [Brachybacterium sp. P6-10-X1]|uniref:YdhK family protein n=1 Tax=Brachybacterium sp. P6-10-X1 TaxID=1903186 RepID=UPI000971A75C|nr:YdhK family protein [Brachybacterium sp. P6-10-X1]APX32697.1 hypothetical protein BH708_08185 [Brachybacterium sp. P6-10-X1]